MEKERWLKLAGEAADVLRNGYGLAPSPKAALVLGSGWGDAIRELGTERHRIGMAWVPGFIVPTVGSHAGDVVIIETSGRSDLLVFRGRTHWNERVDVHQVVHAVRTAAAAGCQHLVLTNAAGTLRPEWPVGTLVAISDHLNLTGDSPAFDHVSMNDAYDPALVDLCLKLDSNVQAGVYAQVRGKQYETPAEIRMLRGLGADLVGMSTALETIAACEAGLKVLGLSLVTNLGAGMSPTPPTHTEVMDVGLQNAGRLGRFLTEIVNRL